MISVITPAFNSSRFIVETIRSVQAQTWTDWEMLIVDDSSSDNTVEVVQRVAENDDRIRLTELPKNMGAAEARNVGLRVAQGPYIAFLDSDDLWLPDKLKRQMDFIQEGDYAFTYTDYECVNEDLSKVLYTVHAPPIMAYRAYLRNTTIGTLTVLINRERTGNFEMNPIRSSHDMALWLRLMRHGHRAFGLPEVLAKYRQVDGSNTSSKILAAKDVWHVYRTIEELSLTYSAYCFVHYAMNALLKRRGRTRAF